MRIQTKQLNCLIVALAFAILGWFFSPWLFVPALLFLICALHPIPASFIYGYWIKLGKLLGKVNALIILTVLFFIILVPLAAIRKLFRKKDDFRTGNFVSRNHEYRAADLQNPW